MEAELEKILANKDKLKAEKLDTLKFADAITTRIVKDKTTSYKGEASKSTSTLKTIIGNTYNWLDSHNDVHVKDCFKQSLEENKQVFHLHDHEFKISSQVGEVKDVYERSMSWKDLGVDKEGETQVLAMDTDISKTYDTRIKEDYLSNKINQHSVGMRYVKVDLAVNTTDEDYKEEKKLWDETIDLLGNREKAESQNYFWVVKEAKLVEISCVLRGSNELTPTIKEEAAQLDDADIQLIRNTLNFI